jgi:membrane-associated phospholipid phosphatase
MAFKRSTQLRFEGAVLILAASLWTSTALAGGGPLGIDHKWGYDNSGVWKRSNQTTLQNLLVAGEFVGGMWEGGETRLGKTYWQAIDASLLAGLSAQPLKYAFTRARPSQTDDPNLWFQHGSHYSFPSGEVAAVTAIVTPFILEYGHEQPGVYALGLLPAYDAIARMKVQAHWQTDVMAGFALGAAAGYFAHNREAAFTLSMLPHGVMAGLHKVF